MQPRRVLIKGEPQRGEIFRLSDEEAHYLARVLRLKEGDEVNPFNGRGWSGRAAITRAAGGVVELRLLDSSRAAEPAHTFSIAQALLKAPAMERAIQSCTELGASSIIAFGAARSIPRSRGPSRGRISRLEKTAVEACRQCRRDFIPEVTLLMGTEELASLIPSFTNVFVASPERGKKPLGEILPPLAGSGNLRILLVTGPEGDFTTDELDCLAGRGAAPCLLSDAILRAETASIAGAAIIANHLMPARLK